MHVRGNTILITGGGSGIGRGLAVALHARGNQVIITGRDLQKLAAEKRANPGIVSRRLDVDDPAAIATFASSIVDEFPALNVVINSAGILPAENVLSGDTKIAEAVILTNLLGPIRLINALLPHFSRLSSSAILLISSGLGFVPLAFVPTYSATKAAIHSYSQSLSGNSCVTLPFKSSNLFLPTRKQKSSAKSRRLILMQCRSLITYLKR